MELRLRENTIYITGDIEVGDATKLTEFVHGVPREQAPGVDVTRVSLSSPGGNLLEGIRIGEAFRALHLPTIVESRSECYSACAVAFLGGTFEYATGHGPKREMEFGARLGFHGYKLAADEIRLENEVLDEARIVNSIVVDYAQQMGNVDLGFFSTLLNISPTDIRLINTSQSINALGINLVGSPLKLERDWYRDACVAAVEARLNPLDGIGAKSRVNDDAAPVKDVSDYRAKLVNDAYPPGPD